jgi:glycosyltransferase involved in cell wall biosynthesis
MKILMVHTFHHARGGDSTYTRGLTCLLERAGHTVIPLCMRHPDNDPSPWEQRWPGWVDPEARGPGALRAAPRAIWSREAAQAVARLIEEERPDIAHLQHVHRHLSPSVLGPLQRARVPTCWTVHDYELICPQGLLLAPDGPCQRCKGHRYSEAVRHRCKRGSVIQSLGVAVEKWIHHRLGVPSRVDRFLCPSRFLADRLIEFGLPADRVVHQPNFVDPAPASDEAGEGVVYAGRLSVEKGVDVLIAAVRRLPGERLTICGEGPDAARLRALAADLPQVRFVGHLPAQTLSEALRVARVVVVPSRWYENFPYAALEGQAAGRAVVASAIGGLPEQIDHGVDGLLVPPGDPVALADALRPLLADAAAARRLGEAAARRVRERLSPEAHQRAILEHYRALAARPGQGRVGP